MSKKPKKRGRGRPRIDDDPLSVSVHVKLTGDINDLLESIRLARTVPPSRNAMAREAIKIGLTELSKRKGAA